MEGGRQGGREVGMMLCRERASVEEERVEGGRVDEGNERRNGTERGMDGRGKEGREEASGGWIERGRKGVWEDGREGNFTGGSIFTNQPFTNRPLPLRLWCYI